LKRTPWRPPVPGTWGTRPLRPPPWGTRPRGTLVRVGSVVLSRASYAFRQSGRMEEEPFSRLILAVLFACARVDTCHPWNCMHSTSTHHPCTSSPCQELRIKHKMHLSFWNNIKILFPRLKPLGSTLSPFSHLPAPNSLPSLWMLSPPSLIHRGRSAHGGVNILLMCCIHSGTKSGPWPPTLRLPGLTNT
jgi:hypothetical protein